MISGTSRLYGFAALLIALGLLLVAFLPPDLFDRVGICIVVGTAFGHVVIASAWVPFGPARLITRLPVSVLWVILLLAASWFNFVIYKQAAGEIVVLLGVCFLGQWLLIQIPLWLLIVSQGVRLKAWDQEQQLSSRRDQQFGLRDLFIFTTLVGIALGVGRVALANVSTMALFHRELPILIFLAATAVLIALPLLLAGLLSRWAVPAVVIVLGLIGLTMIWERPALSYLGGGGGSPAWEQLVALNVSTAVSVLAFVMAARLSGYRLCRPTRVSAESRAA